MFIQHGKSRRKKGFLLSNCGRASNRKLKRSHSLKNFALDKTVKKYALGITHFILTGREMVQESSLCHVTLHLLCIKQLEQVLASFLNFAQPEPSAGKVTQNHSALTADLVSYSLLEQLSS